MTAPPLPTFVPQDAWYTLTVGGVNPSEADTVPNATYLHPSSTPQGDVDGLVGSLDGALIYLAGLTHQLDGGQKFLMWRASSFQADDGVDVFTPWVDVTKPGRWVNADQLSPTPGLPTTVTRFVLAGGGHNVQSSGALFITLFVKGRSNSTPTNLAMPGSTFTGQRITIKDANGDAGTYNIIVSAPSIDGSPTDTLTNDYQERTYTWNGTEWSIM